MKRKLLQRLLGFALVAMLALGSVGTALAWEP